MEINIYSPDCDASKIVGFTIVVDVLRAFSVAYFINENQPFRYILLDSIEYAFELKQNIKNAILIGERKGVKIPGFDYGNSPTEIANKNFRQNTIIHTTTAGTKGLIAQNRSNEIVVGSFVNAQALLEYIRKNRIETVNIYCTAPKNETNGEEDYYFAEYIKSSLLNIPFDFNKTVEIMKKGTGKGFSDTGFAPYSDFTYCMDLNRYNTILRVKENSFYQNTIELEEFFLTPAST
jgi:2-phosphosulfolactate phosphatase